MYEGTFNFIIREESLNMDIENILENWLPTVFTILVVCLIYYVAKLILSRQSKGKADKSLIKSITLFVIALSGIVAILLAIPMPESVKGQITGLIGIVISAVLALSSATFIGNALAGIMLRAINNFKTGDFIRVNDVFGRVTERGLFHTEVQTETRDLLTLPNMFLATNPIRVTRASGTYVEGVVSLGYDVNQNKIKEALINAAKNAGLEDSFVRVTELGDFSVVYKVYGLLKDAKTIISAQSRLNSSLLDSLHEAGIEIVSPKFVNQNQVTGTTFIPKKIRIKEEVKEDNAVESKIFDKAEQAESIEKRKETLAEIDEKIKEVEVEIKANSEESDLDALKVKSEKLKSIKEKMIVNIDKKVEEISQC